MTSTQISSTVMPPTAQKPRQLEPERTAAKRGLRVELSFPIAILIAFPIHLAMAEKQTAPERHAYSIFLGVLFSLAALCLLVQSRFPAFRRWVAHMFPILAAGVLTLAVGESITSGFQWLPLPYFPSPPAILYNLLYDRAMLFDSTWHSLILLIS